MSSLPSNEFFEPIIEKEDLIEGFKIMWFVINNILLSFQVNGGSYILSENAAREIGH